MSIALCRGFDLSFEGHTATQSEQPVQSSGATWIVYCSPGNSLPRYAADLNVAGAPSSGGIGYTLARMAAWGQTIAHLLHWMHSAPSQEGICPARFRFSHWLVPVGHVPSTGNALTGSSSPRPSSIAAVTRCTKSGARAETGTGRRCDAVARPGCGTSARYASAASTTAKLLATTSGALAA